jgi:NAD(P)-dependent dehydrogenase (short-subunit alcohol dehydrogenase family)
MSATRTALVTGANKGIGLEVARQLAALGWRVFVGARDAVRGEAAAESIEGDAELLELDVTQPTSIAKAVREMGAQVSQLDVLVNNAAILEDGDSSVLSLSPEIARRTLETNVLGPLRVTQGFVPLLRKSPAARVINVSSAAGQLGGDLSGFAPAYSISKTALNGLTVQLAAALPGMAVNSISPGWVRTDMGGSNAPRSVQEGAAGIVWLAAEAPQSLTGKFLRDREILDW